jgi:3-deoxy-D-arabino-heptulosonate 7-phosphate (DAHP) synthase
MTELKNILVEEAPEQTIEQMNRSDLREILRKADQRMMHVLGPIRDAQLMVAKRGDQMGFTAKEQEDLAKALEFVFVRASHLANRKIGKEIIEDILEIE